jgi:hypothetical protein
MDITHKVFQERRGINTSCRIHSYKEERGNRKEGQWTAEYPYPPEKDQEEIAAKFIKDGPHGPIDEWDRNLRKCPRKQRRAERDGMDEVP